MQRGVSVVPGRRSLVRWEECVWGGHLDVRSENGSIFFSSDFQWFQYQRHTSHSGSLLQYPCNSKLPGKFDKAYRRSRDAISFFIITGWLSRLRCVSGGDVEEVRIDVT